MCRESEREEWIPKWRDIARKYGLKMLFWGSTMGVKEHVVFVFEAEKSWWRPWRRTVS